MNKDLQIAILFENLEILEKMEDYAEFSEPINQLFNYELDELNTTLDNCNYSDADKIFFHIRILYYKFDIFSLEKTLINSKKLIEKEVYELLKIESLLLKNKIHELSSFSRLKDEIASRVTEIFSVKNIYIKSLAKTFEGDNLSLSNNYFHAQKSFEKALELNPNNIRAKIGLIKSLYYLEEYKKCHEFIKDYNILNHSAIGKYKAKLFKKEKRNQEAISALMKLIELDRFYFDAYLDLFDIYKKEREKKLTDSIMKLIKTRFPYLANTSKFRYYEARNYIINREYDKGIKIFKYLDKSQIHDPYLKYVIGKELSLRGINTEDSKVDIFNEAVEYLEASVENYQKEINILKDAGPFNAKVIEKFNNKMFHAKYSLAVTLNSLKNYDLAIDHFNHLLQIKSDDYFILKSMSIAYLQLQRYDIALPYFIKTEKILEKAESDIYPKSKSTFYRELSFCLLKLEKYKKAEEKAVLAISYNKDNFTAYLTLSEIQLYLKKYDKASTNVTIYLDNHSKYIDLAHELQRNIHYHQAKNTTPLDAKKKKQELIGFFNSKDINSKSISEAEKEFNNRILKSRTLNSKNNHLIILRRWNSYTPILNLHQSKGGGYFFNYNNTGIVIDPGLDFLENFFNNGYSLQDIDKIFISHAHNDHIADLESIITLIYKHNSNNRAKHKVQLYFNIGSFKKYSNNLNLQDNFSISDVFILNPDTCYSINDSIKLHTIKAKHDEIISSKYCLSFIFELVEDSKKIKIAFTNDTGYNKKSSEIIKSHDPDILITHIGTIKDFEFNSDKYYNKHLGLNGTINLINDCNAKINIISEFGEELKFCRAIITNGISTIYNKRVFPGDIGVNIRFDDFKILETIPRRKPFTSCKSDYILAEDACAKEKKNKIIIYHKSITNPEKFINEYYEYLTNQNNLPI